MMSFRLLCAAGAALATSLALGACTPETPVSVDRTAPPQTRIAEGPAQTILVVKGLAEAVTITGLAANHGACALSPGAVHFPYTLKSGEMLEAQANCADPVLDVETNFGTWTFTFPRIASYFT
jgi:hypothetical protein